MGIKHLNQYLTSHCTEKSIQSICLEALSGKTVVIDTSIYLYKFIGDNALMENMYLFISILLHYRIQPIFVFDGKPPPEKRDLIHRRTAKKKEAEIQYKQLKTGFAELSDDDKRDALTEMDALKKQFIRVRDEDIRQVKQLMDAYGVNYYDAPAEADLLCVHFVQNGTAYACISDDMDMFLYGCPRVIRNISLMKHTAKLYDTQSILSELSLSEQHFREIMVLSGTDYNIHSVTSLKETLRWFHTYQTYKQAALTDSKPVLEFYVWLMRNTKYIQDFMGLLRTYQLFQIQYEKDLEKWDTIEIVTKRSNCVLLHNIMSKDGFVFV